MVHRIAGFYVLTFLSANFVICLLYTSSRALSWFIEGNDSLEQELSNGTLEEVLYGLTAAYSLISVENFTMLLDLAKNVANLTAKQKL